MSLLTTVFWQLDPAEFARMHAAEHTARRAWLDGKIAATRAILAAGVRCTRLQMDLLDDLNHFEDMKKAMYWEEEAGQP